jgi:chromosome condensin MukBEF MukE localization factor
MSNVYDEMFEMTVGKALRDDATRHLTGDDLMRYVLEEVAKGKEENARTLGDIYKISAMTLAVTVAIAVKLFFGL